VILLQEKNAADPTAKPAVRYKRTTSKPVVDGAKNQAAKQTFAETFPRAAVYVTAAGQDANAGTAAAPKRHVSAALATAVTIGARDVYVGAGRFDEAAPLALVDNVHVHGSYKPDWSRAASVTTTISAAGTAALADGDTGVTLSLLELHATQGDDLSVYGLRAVDGSSVTLVGAKIRADDAKAGDDGKKGDDGSPGAPGTPGGSGGAGGVSLFGCDGGPGGPLASGVATGSEGSDGLSPQGGGTPGTGGSGGPAGSCGLTSSTNEGPPEGSVRGAPRGRRWTVSGWARPGRPARPASPAGAEAAEAAEAARRALPT
jgi:hypothetical protein